MIICNVAGHYQLGMGVAFKGRSSSWPTCAPCEDAASASAIRTCTSAVSRDGADRVAEANARARPDHGQPRGRHGASTSCRSEMAPSTLPAWRRPKGIRDQGPETWVDVDMRFDASYRGGPMHAMPSWFRKPPRRERRARRKLARAHAKPVRRRSWPNVLFKSDEARSGTSRGRFGSSQAIQCGSWRAAARRRVAAYLSVEEMLTSARIVVGEVQVRHEGPGFTAGGFLSHVARFAFVDGESTPAMFGLLANLGRSGPTFRGRSFPGPLAARAGQREEELATLLRLWSVRAVVFDQRGLRPRA